MNIIYIQNLYIYTKLHGVGAALDRVGVGAALDRVHLGLGLALSNNDSLGESGRNWMQKYCVTAALMSCCS